ncbi:MAG: pyridoxal phosphate-dependent aminotransferase [Acidobacteriaceae bacterium]
MAVSRGNNEGGRFARRTDWEPEETEWSRALAERRRRGLAVFDLTASNPTRCGFEYDAERLLAPLRDPAALDYDPDPRGMLSARGAVAHYYGQHQDRDGRPLAISPEQMVLTTSTSEAYSFLFRLLCDAGDTVLIAQPSYPLFDLLATLDDVHLRPYELFYDHGWHLDIAGLRQRVTETTRAIVLVHPNNPTGHFTQPRERAELEALCLEHGLALIVDEVFLDYPSEGHEQGLSFAAGPHDVLTFVLSGLSKVAALPQMKVAWIACFGPEDEQREALRRLEVIADTFLSMNAPVQCALPRWLADRHSLQQQIRMRVAENLSMLDGLLAPEGLVDRLIIEGGWYAILRIPALEPDDALALRLLEEQGVAVHAGHFFGFSNSGWLVASLLPPVAEFAEGIRRLLVEINQPHP